MSIPQLERNERHDLMERCLDLIIIKNPELTQKINRYDRKIILALMRNGQSISGIAEETKINRKTVAIRVKRLRRLRIVSIRKGRNPRCILSETFAELVAEASRYI